MARHEGNDSIESGAGRSGALPAEARTASLEGAARELADHYGLSSERVLQVLRAVRAASIASPDIGGLDAPEVRSVLVAAIDELGAERAVRLFEEEDLVGLLRRVVATVLLWARRVVPTEEPLLTVDQLIARTETAIRDLEANRERLETDGLGWDCPRPDYHDLILMNLYPIRPHWLTTRPTGGLTPARADLPHPGQAERTTEGPPTPGDDGVAPSAGPLAGPYDEVGASLCHDAVPEAGATRTAWLDPSDADRLRKGRPKLLALKVDVLRQVVGTLRRRDPASLWPGCLALLTDALTASEVWFYLRMDLCLRRAAYPVDGRVVTARVPGMAEGLALGGFLDLVCFVGYCEEVLTIGAADRLNPTIPDGLTLESSHPYFKAIGRPWRAELDAALDLFTELAREERAFRQEWLLRFDHAQNVEFLETVTLDVPIKRPYAAQFETYLRMLSEFGKSHIELTGILPHVQLSMATEQSTTSANVFRREGDYWVLVYAGKRALVQHTLGLSYIALLLRSPNQGRSAVELVAEETRSTASSAVRGFHALTGEQLEDQGMRVAGLGDAGETVDKVTLATVKEQWADLQAELRDEEERGDPERASELRERVQQLEDYVTANRGLGGRPRRAADPIERTRKAVSGAIDRARKNIEQAHPDLGRHLWRTIHPGKICSYDPDDPRPSWELR